MHPELKRLADEKANKMEPVSMADLKELAIYDSILYACFRLQEDQGLTDDDMLRRAVYIQTRRAKYLEDELVKLHWRGPIDLTPKPSTTDNPTDTTTTKATASPTKEEEEIESKGKEVEMELRKHKGTKGR